MANIGKAIKKEEGLLEKEFKKEEKGLVWFLKSHTFRFLVAIVVFVGLIVLVLYLTDLQSRIYIEDSTISAPVISLSTISPGVLEKVFIREGNYVGENISVAQVGGNLIKTKVSGIIIYVQNTPGQIVTSQSPVAKMIDPNEIRVVGHIKEDRGLKDIKVGQRVKFTVDAFPNKKYEGLVSSISPTARSSDIVFSISDKRQEQKFDVKVRFNTGEYPELKNGMSAKMWIYK